MKTAFKILLYGKAYEHLFSRDYVLFIFKEFEYLSSEKLYNNNERPKEFYPILDFLIKEDFIAKETAGYRIKERGKVKLAQGGFLRDELRKRTVFLCTIIAALAGSIAAIGAIFH